ncbi:MAG: hypothetical protein ACWA44_15290 [Thiotrichales bacterium]
MNLDYSFLDALVVCCNTADPNKGTNALAASVNELNPDIKFNHVLTRGNWYRLGGVVDRDYNRISDNITVWAEEESDGDPDNLIGKYMDAGYFATRISGKTHYLTAVTGQDPEDFLQLEVEELQEVISRPLVDPDWFPESIEEFVDPLDFPTLEPEAVNKPVFVLRRITPIDEFLHENAPESRSVSNLKRFLRDWGASSAAEAGAFCNHWVLAMREFQNTEGECKKTARPLSTYALDMPDLPPGETLKGAELAHAIHTFDHQIGYPFAWFFMMLTHKSENFTLAEAVLRDQMGAYDYLPKKDLKLLRAWEQRPYAV